MSISHFTYMNIVHAYLAHFCTVNLLHDVYAYVRIMYY